MMPVWSLTSLVPDSSSQTVCREPVCTSMMESTSAWLTVRATIASPEFLRCAGSSDSFLPTKIAVYMPDTISMPDLSRRESCRIFSGEESGLSDSDLAGAVWFVMRCGLTATRIRQLKDFGRTIRTKIECF